MEEKERKKSQQEAKLVSITIGGTRREEKKRKGRK